MWLKKLFSNSWIITVSATLIGVFVALYLNQRIDAAKANEQKEVANTNILEEITSNRHNLESSLKMHRQMAETFEFLSNNTDSTGNLVTTVQTMSAFRKQHPDVILLEDSTLLQADTFHYQGELNLDFNLSHMVLSTIAWESLKSSGLTSTYNFDCLLYLEFINKMTLEVTQRNEELLEFANNTSQKSGKYEGLIKHLRLLIDFEQILIKNYANADEELKNCAS